LKLPGQPSYHVPAYKKYADDRPVPMGKPPKDKVIDKITLTAVCNGHTHRAIYRHYRFSGWALWRYDPILAFLKFCGKPADARRALKKRGFSWSWT